MRALVAAARPADVAAVAGAMRAADREEVWAWGRHDPETALRLSLAGSVLCWTGFLDERAVCMFGVGAPTLCSLEASPWFLGTDALDAVPVTMARMSRAWLREMMIFPVLANWSDARHVSAHRWLSWLGFKLGEARPAGALGLPFRPFAMEVTRV